MRHPGQMTLVQITNPNPHPLIVWRGAVLQDTVLARHALTTPLTDDLRLSYEGKRALVVLQVDGDDLSAEEWVQRVGPSPVPVSPDLAYRPEGAHA